MNFINKTVFLLKHNQVKYRDIEFYKHMNCIQSNSQISLHLNFILLRLSLLWQCQNKYISHDSLFVRLNGGFVERWTIKYFDEEDKFTLNISLEQN